MGISLLFTGCSTSSKNVDYSFDGVEVTKSIYEKRQQEKEDKLTDFNKRLGTYLVTEEQTQEWDTVQEKYRESNQSSELIEYENQLTELLSIFETHSKEVYDEKSSMFTDLYNEYLNGLNVSDSELQSETREFYVIINNISRNMQVSSMETTPTWGYKQAIDELDKSYNLIKEKINAK